MAMNSNFFWYYRENLPENEKEEFINKYSNLACKLYFIYNDKVVLEFQDLGIENKNQNLELKL